MRSSDFRRIVLELSDVVESSHMGHPDFRVGNRIFATLREADRFGMVVLTPAQQQRFVADYPKAFEPESGAWGRSGCTRVLLQAVHEEALGEAATLAWQNAVDKGPARQSRRRRSAKPVRKTRTR
jgi:hypothetical protein